MKFCWCTLHIKNLEKSRRFYEDIVGLKVDRMIDAGLRQILFMGEGETQIELVHEPEKRRIDVGKDISLGFQVESLDEMIAFVEERGIKIEAGPMQPNPHVKFFYVKDPDGLMIQFVETMN
jgi:lactoylglutathione lyase